ncbi:MAG: hypothetical protein KAJ19_16445, partial [Gammaproteobacteria bacterium]|nr:hypothetical protein [Gammaproteobacteria bacterium]
KDYFESLQDVEILERIGDLAAAPWYIRTNYSHLLTSLLEDQNKVKAITLLKEANEIMARGMEVEGEMKRGVQEGLMHIMEQSNDLIVPDFHTKTFGDIRQDGQEMIDEYNEAETNKGKVWGRFSGLEEVDVNCKGAKKGELWVHAAFPGQLKTTLAANWCYNLITHYKTNVVYVSLEMPYQQMRRNIYTIHSAHSKFRAQGYAPLDYRKIRDGELSAEEKEFYHKVVIPDFNNNPDYCQFYVVTPEREWNMDDIRMQLELMHKRFEVGFVVIDHGQWVEARKGKKNKDYTIELNSVVRDSKRLALHFNRREGVPVLMLWQINRQGHEDAVKNDGVYSLKALTYANECVAEGTLVKTGSGLRAVEGIVPGDTVWSRSGWRSVLNRFDNGIQPLVQVTTDRGVQLSTTGSHRLRGIADGQITWVAVQDIQDGSYVLSDFGTRPFPQTPPSLPSLEVGFHESPTGRTGVPIKTPKNLTQDLAYLMGAHLGDGILTRKQAVIGFTGNRKETAVRGKLRAAFVRSFNHDLYLSEAPSRPGSFDLRKQSKPLCRWFQAVGMDRKPGVPESILCAPRDMVLAFLLGVWDTDGSINNQGVVTLGLKERDERTLREIQLLMQDLGIDTTLSFGVQKLKGTQFGRWVLRVRSRVSRKRFSSLIGFTEPKKQQKLIAAVQRVQRSRKRIGDTYWPVLSIFRDLYLRHRKKHWRGAGVVFDRKVTRANRLGGVIHEGALASLLESLVGVEEDPQLDFLRDLYATTLPQRVQIRVLDQSA